MQVFAVKRLGLPAAGHGRRPTLQSLQFRISPLNPRPKTDSWLSRFHLASVENSAFLRMSELQPGSPMENAILTPEVLAKRWSISLSTVARWRSEGMGPAFLKLRGHVRYRLEDIESFERQTLQSATGCKSERTNPQD
jgi:hypothetical protein